MSNEVQKQQDDAQMLYLSMLLDRGCEFLFKTTIPAYPWASQKEYVWMRDSHGDIFLERLPEATDDE